MKCPFSQCKYSTKGFAYQRGVDRHILDRHKNELQLECPNAADQARLDLAKKAPKEYFCTEERCPWKIECRAFARKDHLLRHLTDKHGRPKQKRGRHARK